MAIQVSITTKWYQTKYRSLFQTGLCGPSQYKDGLTTVFSLQWKYHSWNDRLYVETGPCSPCPANFRTRMCTYFEFGSICAERLAGLLMNTRGFFFKKNLAQIRECISDCIHVFLWAAISHPCHNHSNELKEPPLTLWHARIVTSRFAAFSLTSMSEI